MVTWINTSTEPRHPGGTQEVTANVTVVRKFGLFLVKAKGAGKGKGNRKKEATFSSKGQTLLESGFGEHPESCLKSFHMTR